MKTNENYLLIAPKGIEIAGVNGKLNNPVTLLIAPKGIEMKTSEYKPQKHLTFNRTKRN